MNNADILLCTLNSTYQHSSFGLRYIKANMGELEPRCQILEGTIKENPRTFVEKILSSNPRIVGFGIYIWNTSHTLEVMMILKKVAPHIIVIVGGPEISYNTSEQSHIKWCDYVIQGEADFSMRELCIKLLASEEVSANSNLTVSHAQIIPPALPDIKQIIMPYDLYSADDIKNRVIYVEASRGCPYKCEYCLSSLDKSVRSFDLDLFLAEMNKLLDRGARTFKFVDRTFNLSPTTSTRILQFFLKHVEKGLFLHFELVPDRLPVEIRELIAQFPAGSLQFEIGIQTLNPVVAQNVSRKNDLVKVEENFKYLREFTKVHTHADLIVGLPGETLASFAEGFDRLAAFGPDEIQVGILKRLKGTPITRHDKTYQMVYSDIQPYQILSTSTLSFKELQKMNRFAKFWDLYANSGDFKNFMLWISSEPSLFNSFFALSEFLSEQYSETHSISLISLAEQAYRYMLLRGVPVDKAAGIIEKDYCQLSATGVRRRDLPPFLKRELRNSELHSEQRTEPHAEPLKADVAEESVKSVLNPAKLEKSLNQRQLKHINSL